MRVTIELRDASTGRVISGGWVRVLLDAAGRWASRGGRRVEERLVLGPMPGGRYTVQGGAEGFLPRVLEVTVPTDEVVRVELVRGGRISGEVLASDGRPLVDAQVRWDMGRPDVGAARASRASPRWGQGRSKGSWVPRGQLGVLTGPLPPIPEAFAATSTPAASSLVVRTDALGRFVLQGVPPGRGRVVASAPGHAPGASQWWQLPPGADLDGVTLHLREGGALLGRVLSADGSRGIAHLPVLAEAALEPLPRFAATDEAGRFRFDGVAGDVRLLLGPPGPGRLSVEVHVAPGERHEASWRVPIMQRRVQVRVLDAAGRPLEGAWVTLVSARADVQGRWEAVTERDGFAHFDGVVEPPWRLAAGHEGWGELERRVEGIPERGEVELRLRPLRSLSARVLDAMRRDGIEGARVTWRPLGRSEQQGRSVSTDGAGRFVLVVGEGEEGWLHVTAEGFVSRRLHVGSSDPLPTRIALRPAGSVEGRVRDRYGMEVHAAVVCSTSEEEAPCEGESVRSDASGRFVLEGVPEGDRWLLVSHPAAGRVWVGPVRVRRGERSKGVEVRLPERGDRVVPR